MSPHQSFSVDIPTDVFFGALTALVAIGMGAIAATVIVQFVATWQASAREKMVNRYALRLNLMVAEGMRPALEHQLAMRTRGGLLGAMAALGVIVAIFLPWSSAPMNLGLASSIISVGSALMLTQLGTIIGGALARRAAPTTETVARLHLVGLAELVAPVERRMAAVAAALAVGLPTLLLVIITLPGADAPEAIARSAPPLAIVGLGAGSLYLALPRIARRLVSRRALLGDAGALAWSDALAAQSLRDLHWLVATVGGLVGFTALQALGVAFPTGAEAATMVWINLIGYLGFIGLLLVIVIVLARSPERHVQRTLWPEFAIVAK
ncbi:hypothetical protein [Microcella humidisoli]|uniref:FtsX-like permease family protein n=1 Tax=Microcella humidisoli TaxID=2963406 RepID=A0ABY5G0T5_9MICO|nr:hypothetical protein [Microcella humidisoli]UTT63576.1 hypothetical protein NNL39_05610 [Microcella humidisoli]